MSQQQTDPTFGIIGAGPSACYLTRALQRAFPNSHITLYEREDTPFGLLNWGVAPDHQHTKAISRQFTGILESPNVTLKTNCEIGRDLSLAALRARHTAVIIATGMWEDKPLPIPTPEPSTPLPVYGGGACLRILNKYPKAPRELPNFGETPAIIGAGNVAMDVLRTLVKQGTATVTLLARSTGFAAKFDTQMLQEIAKLPNLNWDIQLTEQDASAAPESLARPEASRLKLLQELENAKNPEAVTTVRLVFGAAPTQLSESADGIALSLQTAHGTRELTVSSIITAIGFTPSPQKDPELNELINLPGNTPLPHGIYRVGWAATGPQGGIPATRQNAIACAKQIADDLTQAEI